MGIQINAQLNDGDSDYIKATEEYVISITIITQIYIYILKG